MSELSAEFRLTYAGQIKEGYAAFQNGDDCPYLAKTDEREAWRYGWRWADRRAGKTTFWEEQYVRPGKPSRQIPYVGVDDAFNQDRPHPIERLARIEGQSNFLSLLQGIESARDTTADMMALSFAKAKGAIPEILETHVAQTNAWRGVILEFLADIVLDELHPKDKDVAWIIGATEDAFDVFRTGRAEPSDDRAKHFHVNKEVYGAARSLAYKILLGILANSSSKWVKARFSGGETPGIRHTTDGKGDEIPEHFWTIDSLRANGCFIARPLSQSDDELDSAGFDTGGIGVTDRLGFDERNNRPSKCVTLYGRDAEEHCRNSPAQTNHPHSL